jgi:hypothetical protein
VILKLSLILAAHDGVYACTCTLKRLKVFVIEIQ